MNAQLVKLTGLPKLKDLIEIDPNKLKEGDFYFNVWGSIVTRRMPFSEHHRDDLLKIKIFTLKNK